jgi:hypothetical protein
MDFPFNRAILAVLILGSGWMLCAWDNRSRRRWF